MSDERIEREHEGKGVLAPNRRKEVASKMDQNNPTAMRISRQPDYIGHITLPQSPLPYPVTFAYITDEGDEVTVQVPQGAVLTSYAAIELGAYIHNQEFFAMKSRRMWTEESPRNV